MPKALIELREKTIKAINESSDKQAFIYKNAELLYNLDLTMYSKNYCLNSLFFNAITSLSDLQFALKINFDILKDNLSFVSNYIIRRMI